MNTEAFDRRLDLYEGWLSKNKCETPSSSQPAADISYALCGALQLRPMVSPSSNIHRLKHVAAAMIAKGAMQGETQCKILAMPKDIFYNIASFMTPLALLNCARSCKAFRTFLIENSESVRLLWKNALAAVPHLPPCPEDMSELWYTALVFDIHCFACGIRGAPVVDYALRLRLCRECYKENVAEGRYFLEDVPDELSSLAMALLPCQIRIDLERLIITHDVSMVDPVNNDIDDHFYKPAFLSVLEVLQGFSTANDISVLKEAMCQHAQTMLKRQTHGTLVLAWDNVARYFGRQHTNAADANCDRRYFVKLLKFSKYMEEDSPLGDIQPTALLREESIREEGGDAFVKHYKQISAERETAKYYKATALQRRINRRLDTMSTLYDEMIASLGFIKPHRYLRCAEVDLFPNRCDGVLLLRQIAGYNSARGDITIPYYVREASYNIEEFDVYRRAYMAGLNRLVNKRKIRVRNKYQAILWPTALFICTACPKSLRRLYRCPEIHAHWREAHPDVRCLFDSGKPRFVKLWDRAWETVPRILGVGGLDVENTDVFSLDCLLKEGRMYCACGDPTLPLPEDLDWVTFVLHMDAHAQAHDVLLASRSGELPSGKSSIPHGTNDLEVLVKYLPDGADTSPASERFSADPVSTLRVWSRLEECPPNMQPACALCKASERKYGFLPSKAIALPDSADGIVYHMETRHGIDFEEENMLFKDLRAITGMH